MTKSKSSLPARRGKSIATSPKKPTSRKSEPWPDQITDDGEVEIKDGGLIFRGALRDQLVEYTKRTGMPVDDIVAAALREARLAEGPVEISVVKSVITLPAELKAWAEDYAYNLNFTLSHLVQGLLELEQHRDNKLWTGKAVTK